MPTAIAPFFYLADDGSEVFVRPGDVVTDKKVLADRAELFSEDPQTPDGPHAPRRAPRRTA